MRNGSTTSSTESRLLSWTVAFLLLVAIGQSACLWNLWTRVRAAEACERSADVARIARDAAILDRLEAIYDALPKKGG